MLGEQLFVKGEMGTIRGPDGIRQLKMMMNCSRAAETDAHAHKHTHAHTPIHTLAYTHWKTAEVESSHKDLGKERKEREPCEEGK